MRFGCCVDERQPSHASCIDGATLHPVAAERSEVARFCEGLPSEIRPGDFGRAKGRPTNQVHFLEQSWWLRGWHGPLDKHDVFSHQTGGAIHFHVSDPERKSETGSLFACAAISFFHAGGRRPAPILIALTHTNSPSTKPFPEINGMN